MTLKRFITSILTLAAFQVSADTKTDFDALTDLISAKLRIGVHSVSETSIGNPSLYQVSTERGLFYVTHDLKHLIAGNVFDTDNGFQNLTEVAMTGIRKDRLDQVSASSIDFKAKDEKYVIHVFTDITCGYCRKLHREMDQYNDLGITIKYLAFPRGGTRSPGYNDMVKVWCSKDPRDAMTKAKSNDSVDADTCESPVASHYKLGGEFSITGTPAMVLPNGEMIPGYLPPSKLISALEQKMGKS